MRKIPTVYLRDEIDRSKVTDVVNPECQWVLDGEGTPTRKYDGTCVMLDDDDRWWARREVKPGKTAPAGFVAVSTDEVTGKTVGWEPIEQSSVAKFHAEAVRARAGQERWATGTYELCGPKIGNKREKTIENKAPRHFLQEHFMADRANSGLAPKDLVRLMADRGWEGIVWHHMDGRMAKLKARDLL